MDNDNRNILDELLAYDGGCLTAWEIDFIDSLNERRDFDLSEKQADVLNRVWDKAFN